MLMLNTNEIQKLGYTQDESNAIIKRLCAACPTKTITIMVNFERGGKYQEISRGVRHVSLSDALNLCDERIKNVRNIKNVDAEFWAEFKKKLENIQL